jgi:hypothetical protein
MKITNENNIRLVSFYKEKLQKICKHEITEAYISYRGELCIKCSNTGYYDNKRVII